MVTGAMLGDPAIENSLKQFLLAVLVALVVAALSQRSGFTKVPYTLLLVIAGLILAFLGVQLVSLSPGLILLIFLPPLLFQAAWNLEWERLKRDWVPIGLYTIVGVLISVACVALGLWWVAGMSLTAALLVGACLAATDPVSVVALFRELGAGKRLTTLMEAESLFNDGVAVVAFGLLVSQSLGGEELTVAVAVARFATVTGIGVAVGAAAGFGLSYLTRRFQFPLVEQSLTLVAAYGVYLVAEDLGGSGVIAVVTVGLVLGNFGSRVGMQPRTRQVVSEFWDFLAFFVNSIVFLLIGNQIRIESLLDNAYFVAVAVLAMVAGRAIGIFGLGGVSDWLANSRLPLRLQTVLWWGGLRGSVAIALALSVPVSVAGREQVIATVFGVVLFTLLVQGTTIKTLLEKLGMLKEEPLRELYLEAVARRVAFEQALAHLSTGGRRAGESAWLLEHVALVETQLAELQSQIDQLQVQHPQLRALAVEQLRDELLAIEADTYANAVRMGLLKQNLDPHLPELFNGLSKDPRPGP